MCAVAAIACSSSLRVGTGQRPTGEAFEALRLFPFGAGDKVVGTGVAALPVGDLAVAGIFRGEVDLGAGHTQAPQNVEVAFVGRYASNGTPRWLRVVQAQTPVQGGRELVADDAGNVFFVARTCGSSQLNALGTPIGSGGCQDAFPVVYALAANGELRFERTLRARSKPRIGALLADGQAGVFVAGASGVDLLADEPAAAARTSSAGQRGFVFRYRADGQRSLFAEVAASHMASMDSLAAVDDAVAVAGTFTGDAMLGSTPLREDGSHALFVARLNRETAEPKWVRTFGSPRDPRAQPSNTGNPSSFGNIHLASLPEGRLLVAGSIAGAAVDFGDGIPKRGFFAMTLGAQGEHIWSRAFPGAIIAEAATRSDGTAILAISLRAELGPRALHDFGDGELVNDHGDDALILSLDADTGRTVASTLFHGQGRRRGEGDVTTTSLAVQSDDAVIATGWFTGTIDFGATRLTGPGEHHDVPDRCKQVGQVAVARQFLALPPPLPPCPSEGWSARTMFVVRMKEQR
jgi:hypothetical protein